MKKNLISIFLLVGVVTLNLSMLCQAQAGSLKDRQANAAAIAAAEHASVSRAAHSKVREVKALCGSGARQSSGVKCVCGGEGPGVHIDFNFIVAALELPPKEQAPHAIQAVVSVFTNADPIPQDRPPKPLA